MSDKTYCQKYQSKTDSIIRLAYPSHNQTSLKRFLPLPNLGLSQRTKRVSLSLFTMSLLLTGCGGNREILLKEVSEFDKSVQVGAESIAAYYSIINEQESQLYWLILELNPNCEAGDFINYKCLNPKFQPPGERKDYVVSPLKQLPIPLESIKARSALLKELADYSKSLATLAGDKSAEKFQGNIKALQNRLSTLEKKFQMLQDQADNPPDSTISKRYLAPIGTIIGILGKTAIQEAQWNEIRKSIIEAEEPVNTVLKAIANDLDTYALPLVRVGADAKYSLLISYYNNNRSRFTQEERAVIVNEIAAYKYTYDLASINKPSEIPNDLVEAHNSLVKLAKSDGSVKDIAELKAWLEEFKEDAEQLRDAVIQLAQIKGVKDNVKSKN
jgi:hypothetical protein